MSGPRSDAEPQSERPASCCSPVTQPSTEAVVEDVRTLDALANDTRYEALRTIATADDGGVCVCDLEPSLGVSQGAVSQALSKLFAAGLVERRKDGRWRYYTATDRARRILDVLDETRDLD